MKRDLESASVHALRTESDRYAQLQDFRATRFLSIGGVKEWTGDWDQEEKAISAPFQAKSRPKSAVLRHLPVQRLCKTTPKSVFLKHTSPPPPIRLVTSPRSSPKCLITPNQVFLNGMPVRRFPTRPQEQRNVAVQAVEPITNRDLGKTNAEVISFARLDMGKRQSGEPEWKRQWREGKGKRTMRLALQIDRVL